MTKPTRDELLARGLKVLTRLPREDWGAGWAGVVTSAAKWDPSEGVSFDSYCWHMAKFAAIDQSRRETGRQNRSKRKGGTHLERERPWGVDDFGEVMTRPAPEPRNDYEAREEVRHLAGLLVDRPHRAVFLARSRGWTMKRIGVWVGLSEARVSQMLILCTKIIRARAGSEVLA